jgi:Molybdopterin-binding domain of aldehyde dehydrogenase
VRPGEIWRDGDAWVAGGTWLFSDDQPHLRRLVGLTSLGWDPLVPGADGLQIGATARLQTCMHLCRWMVGRHDCTCPDLRTAVGDGSSRVRLIQSDTDRTGFGTGAFASAGLFVAGNTVLNASNALRDRILHRITAEIRILYSVRAADPGVVISPGIETFR